MLYMKYFSYIYVEYSLPQILLSDVAGSESQSLYVRYAHKFMCIIKEKIYRSQVSWRGR
jgi:hypothetical protein